MEEKWAEPHKLMGLYQAKICVIGVLENEAETYL